MKEVRRPAPPHAPHYNPQGGFVPKAVKSKARKQQLRAQYRNLLSKPVVQAFRAGVFVAGEEDGTSGEAGAAAGGAGGARAARAPPPPPPPQRAASRFAGAEAEAAKRDAARASRSAAAETAAQSRAAALSARSKQRGAFKRKNGRGQPLLSARMPFLLARLERG